MTSPQAVFLQGSILRHVLVMSATSTLGLLALFFVDLLDMYFLSLLGDSKIVAGVGFSATLLFTLFSMCIGIQIAMGALVARAEGQRDRELAGRYCTHVWIFSFLVMSVVVAVTWLFLEDLLVLIGAEGEVLAHALSYSRIMLPSLLLVAISMCGGAALRSVGDAKRSMYSTLVGGAVNAVLDPIFIFTLGWGVEGAAWASVASRFSVLVVTVYPLFVRHKLPVAPRWKAFVGDLRAIVQVAVPAIITNLMTPIGGAFVLSLVAKYGADAVAAYAVLGRIIPFAFGALFSLSGAVGPIVGQNAGAHQFDRVRFALISSAQVIVIYVIVVWALLFVSGPLIIDIFSVQGQGIAVFETYTRYLVGFFIFAGLLFVANAAFNNLGKAHWSTLFNAGRTFFGSIPMAYLFSEHFGLPGLMFGDSAGVVVFGCVAFGLALFFVGKLENEQYQHSN